MNTKLYISALDNVDDSGIAAKRIAFVSHIRELGYQVYMPLKCREYNIIEKEIDTCDGLIALIDAYWWASTWKLSEVTYALDGVGALSVNKEHKSVPTFLYPLDDQLKKGFIKTQNTPIFLSVDVEKASKKIDKILRAT